VILFLEAALLHINITNILLITIVELYMIQLNYTYFFIKEQFYKNITA